MGLKQPLTAKELIETEIPLLTGLQFHLYVFHPLNSLYAIISDVDSAVNGRLKERPQGVELVLQTAKNFVNQALLTDAPLLANPAQVALACLLLGAAKCEIHLSLQDCGPLAASQATVVEATRTLIQSPPVVKQDQITVINNKLKDWRTANGK